MVLKQLNKIIKSAFKKAGYAFNDAKVIISNRPELCDYQSDSAFLAAKEFSKAPKIIAEEVVKHLQENEKLKGVFSDVSFAMPGFINLKLTNSFINKTLNEMINNNNFNLDKPKVRETVFVDFGGPNIAKPLHVGHLRSAIVGESVKRIINFSGHKTISDVHLGDYGLQIGIVIYGLKQENISKDKITLEVLEYLYPKYNAIGKEDESVKEICAEITKQMQEGHEEYNELHKIILEISGNDILRLYDFLNVSFDLWKGESQAYEHIPAVKTILENKGLLKTSQGAKIVYLDNESSKQDLPPLIFEKSNGAYLYGTTDLASIYNRVKTYNPSKFYYVVDKRQSLHFKQVFSVAKMAGLVSENQMLTHLGFGTVNGKDGKPFKTRAGDAPKLDSLFNQVKEQYVSARLENENANEDDLNKIVNAIIKFADLQNHRERDYVFDIEKFSNITGKTGPYVQYAYLRVQKVINDNKELLTNLLNEKIYGNEDKNLRLKLITLQSAVNLAVEEMLPSVVAEYVYDLCVLLNNFYEKNRINQVNDKAQKSNWITLMQLSNNILKQMLSLLIIDIPTVM